MHISTIEITSKRVGGNNVNFSTIKITSKKYVEITWIFRPAKLCRKKYVERREFFDHRNYIENVQGNDVEIRQNLVFDVSTWIRRGVPVGLSIFN